MPPDSIQGAADEEGLHLNPIPLRRPCSSTRPFRNQRLLIEANVTSNGISQRASSPYSGEHILFEGDILTDKPLNRRLWLRKVPCVSLHPGATEKKEHTFFSLHIPILIIFCAVNSIFHGKRFQYWCIVVSDTHTQESWKVFDSFFMSRKQDASCCREDAAHAIPPSPSPYTPLCLRTISGFVRVLNEQDFVM